MAYKEIREALRDLLKEVSGVGKLYLFRRHEWTEEGIKTAAVHEGRVNVWEITRFAAGQAIDDAQGRVGVEPYFRDTHQVRIIARVAVADSGASELEFQDTIDEVVAKIRQNNLLGGVNLLPRVLQVPVIDHRMFANVLVHYAELTYEGAERSGG